jgi:glyoxylase-like metal-dependent hydrolase (beta-lactamase superfamily II)
MDLTRRDALLAAAATAALPSALAAQTAGADFHRIRVGSLDVTIATEGVIARASLPPTFVPNASPEEVTAALRAGGHESVPANTYNVTAVRTRDGLVLLDCGFGPQGGPAGTGRLAANMSAAGVDLSEVRILAFSHFHGDHIGGLLGAGGAPAFPNARILVPEREWTFWNDEGEMSRGPEARRPAFVNARNRFAPYAARVERFAPGAEIAPGVRAVASPGHAPGHSSFLISDGNDQFFVIADAVNLPALFMARPDWFPSFDMDPPTAVATRRAMLDRLATDRIRAVGYHFPMPATGFVERAGSGYRFVLG